MRLSIKSKHLYLLALVVICLLGIVIMPTYAKFGDEVTFDDVVGINLNYNIGISNIEQFEEVVLEAGESTSFNVNVTNSSGELVYYGIWYKMVNPDKMPNDDSIKIGKLEGTNISTSGSIENGEEITSTIGLINDTSEEIKIYIGVASSSTSTNDIEYINGKYLISGEVSMPVTRDIMITSIKIDGETSNSLPTGGAYTMTSSCDKGSTLRWDTYSKSITYSSGAVVGDKCSVEFTTSTDYLLLNEMPVGSYVEYVGKGGTVGSTSVACQTNGSASSSTASAETEAPNSCSGQNAREDIDTNGNTYGYCYSANYKYYTTGWRIAYIDSNNKPVIISAGSPECNTRTSSTANVTYIQTANAKALKYCNTDYVDGDCTCTDSDADGLCDSASSDAWAINDNDYNMITSQITGTSGGYLYDSISGATKCGGVYSTEVCGYNNDLIDNGGYYWFAAKYSSSGTNGVYWRPYSRYVRSDSDTNAYGLRPVISLSSTVYVTGGTGTMDDPYTILNVTNG